MSRRREKRLRREPQVEAPKPVPATLRRSWKWEWLETGWWGGVVLVLAVLVAYIPAIRGGWVWDDDDYVTRNPTLRSWSGLWRIWFEPGATPQYYPLVHTTFWLEYQLWGLWPGGFHFTSVALHATSALLLWRVLVVLGFPGALWAAAVWGLHPVQVESVAWVTERKNTLSGFFFMAASLLALKHTLHGGRRWHGVPYVASFLLYACALLSKTVTATWPVAVALVWWGRLGTVPRAWLARLLPFLALGGALAAVTVIMERHHVGALGPDWNLTFLERLLIASRALWFYLGKLVWPVGLTFVYPRWEITATDPLAYGWVAACALASLVLLFARSRVGRWPLVAAAYFAVTLAPALGFVNVFPMRYSFVADHYQYLASVGPLALAACSAARFWAARVASTNLTLRRFFGIAIASFLAVSLACRTWVQARAYRDAETLWRDTLQKNPKAWMAHNNLGLHLLEQGELRQAQEHFEQALAAKADDSFAMNNLGLVHAHRGELQRAADWFARAIETDPQQAEAANNLGNVFAQTKQWEAAETAFRLALQRRPAYAEAWNNLANVLAMQGRTGEAIEAYRQAVALDPAYLDALLNLARVLAASGQPEEARQWVERALLVDPRNDAARELRSELRSLPGR